MQILQVFCIKNLVKSFSLFYKNFLLNLYNANIIIYPLNKNFIQVINLTYEQALNYVDSFLQFGINPGLERIKLLLEMIGNPQKKLKFIHVAGTNGKGSICTFLSSILTLSGLKTGLFTSPFILDFRERFKIDGNMISKNDFVNIVEYIMPFVKKMPKNGSNLTEFELITVIAFLWFAKKECDIVVLEVGLGGRLDATNVIDSALVSVITSISYDHVNILGETIEKIAKEKAGIIKSNGTLVLYPKQNNKALFSIKSVAKELKNKIIVPCLNELSNIKTNLSGTSFDYMEETFEITLLGKHQVYNAITAISVINFLKNIGFKISKEHVKKGLADAKIPARFEIISQNPLIILDGSHNMDGATTLANSIKLYLSQKRIIAIVGMLKDKEVSKVLSIVAPLVSDFIAVRPENYRAMDNLELCKLIKNLNKTCTVADNLADAANFAIKQLDENSAILVFGSLYLASQIRPILMSFCEDF